MSLEKEKVLRRTIGERIRTGRKERGLTQAQLAERMDVSNKFISQIERGEQNISLKRLIQIAEAFDCSISFLILGEEANTGLSEKIAQLPEKNRRIIETLVDMMLEE